MQMFIKFPQDHKMTYICQYVTYLHFRREYIFSGINVFINLPVGFKQTFYEVRSFKHTLKRFLLENSFHSLEEYYNWKEN